MRLSVCRKVDFGSAEYGGRLVEFSAVPEENGSLPTCRAIGFDPGRLRLRKRKREFFSRSAFRPEKRYPESGKAVFPSLSTHRETGKSGTNAFHWFVLFFATLRINFAPCGARRLPDTLRLAARRKQNRHTRRNLLAQRGGLYPPVFLLRPHYSKAKKFFHGKKVANSIRARNFFAYSDVF